MKNFKNRFSKKNEDKDKKKSGFGNNRKLSDYQRLNKDKKNIKTKNEFKNIIKTDESKRNEFRNSKGYLKKRDKSQGESHRNDLSSSSSFKTTLKSNQLQISNKSFDDWIWGKHAVFSCLNSDRPINRIWCTSDIYSSEKFYILLKQLKSQGILIEEVSWSRLSQLTNGGVHQGISLQLASSNTVSLNELINTSKRKSTRPILIALDGITDPHNLGAIIRSAEAFDCNGIIIPQRRSAGLTGTVAKVAAGALEHIPVSRVVNLNRAIDQLKKDNFLVIGLSGEGQLALSKFEEKQLPIVVIVGAENKGISLLTQKKCDYLIKVPLKGVTSSLNASVATAISLYHFSNL